MRIAIPLFGTRVSPRFDCATELLVIDEEGGRVVQRERAEIGHFRPFERVGRLAALGVGVLICGGVSGFVVHQLMATGIHVYAWVTGEAEHALSCYLSGRLESGVMTGPGGPCGRWRLGRRGQCGQRWAAEDLGPPGWGGRWPGGGGRRGGRHRP